MFFVTILGSGSAGNCALVETAQTRLLIDGGLSAKQIALRLALCGVDPNGLDAILLTHEHGDHAGALRVWGKQFPTPIYCNRLTAEALQKDSGPARTDWKLFVTGSAFTIKDLTIETFPVPHDAVEPVGFMLHHGGESLGFLTDLGVATKLVQQRVCLAHTLFIETNHDEKLLQNDTRRPWSVKQRIMSRHGHLSNAAAASVLFDLLEAGCLRRAVLGHLSRDCNSSDLALGTVRSRLESAGAHGVEVFCATQREISPRFAVRPDSARTAPPDCDLARSRNTALDCKLAPSRNTELHCEMAQAGSADKGMVDRVWPSTSEARNRPPALLPGWA